MSHPATVSHRATVATGRVPTGVTEPGCRRAGWYPWEDCLIPDDGFYRQETSLNPDNSDWETIRLEDSERLSQSAIFTWGSFLDPI